MKIVASCVYIIAFVAALFVVSGCAKSRVDDHYTMVLKKRGKGVISNVNITYPEFIYAGPFSSPRQSKLGPESYRSFGPIPLPLPATVTASWLTPDGRRREVLVTIPEEVRPRQRDYIIFWFHDEDLVSVEKIERKAIDNAAPGKGHPLYRLFAKTAEADAEQGDHDGHELR